jgi:predicted transcriptional regulator
LKKRYDATYYHDSNVIVDSSDNRRVVYQFIEDNPGVHIRKIIKSLGLAAGDTQYHLDKLQREGWIKSLKIGAHRHYYPADITDEKDEVVLAFLMHDTARDILVRLIEHPGSTQGDIARFKQLSAPTINWYMSRLISAGIVVGVREGRIIRYFIQDIGGLIDTLIDYYPDIWNSIASRLVGMFVRISSERLKKNNK